jgi:hypothetical protein
VRPIDSRGEEDQVFTRGTEGGKGVHVHAISEAVRCDPHLLTIHRLQLGLQ